MASQPTVDGIPVPPPHLIARIFPINETSEEENQLSFVASGAQSLRELESLLSHSSVDLNSELDVLDWGCGSGRVTLQLAQRYPALKITGVDVDAGAIAWLNSLGLPSRFDICETSPPLPYEDRSFDLCVNHSVLTHIDEDDQRAWLAEIARLVRPGGHFVTSVHGMRALMGQAPFLEAEGISTERWYEEWSRRQFVWVPDDHFTGSTHGAGYHTTFQDPATVEEFSAYSFEPLCFIFGGDLGLQDHLLFVRRSDEDAARRARARRLRPSSAEAPGTVEVAEPAAPAGASPQSVEELIRVWSMAAGNLSSVGQQLGRLEDSIWTLSHEVERLKGGSISASGTSLAHRATNKLRRMLHGGSQPAS
jgi:SAM-dependent methyltransferase